MATREEPEPLEKPGTTKISRSGGKNLTGVDYLNSTLAVFALVLGCINTCQNWTQKESLETQKLHQFLNNAWNYLQLEDVERARQELGVARDLNKEHPRYLLYMGYLAQRTKNPGRAADYYEEALKLRAEYVPALCYLGVLYLEQGELNDAARFLRRAERLSADQDESNEAGRPFILLNLGNVHLGNRDLEAAKKRFVEGLQLDPENPQLHAGLGTYYARKGEMVNAVSEYWQALKGEPKDPKLFAALASTLYLIDDLASAEDALRRALDLEEDRETMRFLALVVEEQGRIEEAEDLWQRAERTRFSPEGLGALLGEVRERDGEVMAVE